MGTIAGNLTGKLLLAMPGMTDPRFYHSVIFMCAHDEKGSMGLVINHSFLNLNLGQLFEHLSMKPQENAPLTVPVLTGGPVETGRGFLLHTLDFRQSDTLEVSPGFGVTGTVDALKTIASGQGPRDFLFLLGYSGWNAGQLEQEIQSNTWMIAEADHNLIFNTGIEEKWDRAMGRIGVDPSMLSSAAGRA
jgi:putative transcriptional regulator